MNKGGDLMAVYIALVDEKVLREKTSFVEIAESINPIPTLNLSL